MMLMRGLWTKVRPENLLKFPNEYYHDKMQTENPQLSRPFAVQVEQSHWKKFRYLHLNEFSINKVACPKFGHPAEQWWVKGGLKSTELLVFLANLTPRPWTDVLIMVWTDRDIEPRWTNYFFGGNYIKLLNFFAYFSSGAYKVPYPPHPRVYQVCWGRI